MSRSASPPAAASRSRRKTSRFQGHAIECRINAEDPRTFVPSPGTITHFHTPGGLGVRVDSGVYSGYRIPPYYDSLIGKLIVHGRNRVECMMRLRRALDEFVVDGIETTLPLFRDLVGNPDIANGDYDIHWLEKYLAGKRTERLRSNDAAYAPRLSHPARSSAEGLCLGRLPDGRSADDPEVFWVEPEMRGIIPLDGFHVPQAWPRRSASGRFEIRFDTDFRGVIDGCAAAARGAAARTWINGPIREAYIGAASRSATAHTVEAWRRRSWSAGSTA